MPCLLVVVILTSPNLIIHKISSCKSLLFPQGPLHSFPFPFPFHVFVSLFLLPIHNDILHVLYIAYYLLRPSFGTFCARLRIHLTLELKEHRYRSRPHLLLLSGSRHLGNGLDFVLHPAYNVIDALPT
ncbi:hypothetical protein BDV39DRAFT_186195 [Aspergillus sergii]|uniref:Uncharacterized protein n=1 Tax=Aspergillus sergii TaxID=1034303 RepID=A0A5N6WP31_9EURO|nr:hypothetical protein BDV39DRAFT_186195 [Aspergillus sergii]